MLFFSKRNFLKHRISLIAAGISPLLIILLLTVKTISSHEGAHVYKIGGTQISFPEMIEEISPEKVIFVGEKHNNPGHHQTQLDVIKGIHQKSIPLAVGLEMFTARDQQYLDGWVAGTISEKELAKVFKRNWGFSWKLYRDIFLYAREEKIPLIGLNVPRKITRKVAKKGFMALTEEELAALPAGISCDLDKRYRDFIIRLFVFKGGRGKSFNHFCEAQVVWDQAMAWHLAAYLKQNPNRKVVVLAGAVHAWKYGIARQLQKYTDASKAVILPDLPGDYRDISKQDADYLVLFLQKEN